MTITLRLSPRLDSEVRHHAELLGVPLNTFVVLALDYYLRDMTHQGLSPRACVVHDFLSVSTVVHFSAAAAPAPATCEDVGRGGCSSLTPPRGNHGETSNTSEVQGTHQ